MAKEEIAKKEEKRREVIVITGGKIEELNSQNGLMESSIYEKIRSNKTITSPSYINCSEHDKPLLSLCEMSYGLKEIKKDRAINSNKKFPPLIIIVGHGSMKEGVHYTKLSTNESLPTALIFSQLRKDFGDQKIDVISTACSPSDTTKFTQLLAPGSIVMTMGDSKKPVLVSSIGENLERIDFQRSAKKIFADILIEGAGQGFTIPRIERSGKKEILLSDIIIANNKKKYNNLSQDKQLDVDKKVAFRNIINKVYSEYGDLDVSILKKELQESTVLKESPQTKIIIGKIINTIENAQIIDNNDKIFQINTYLQELDQNINQKNPELITIAHSKSNDPDLDKMTKIYPYEEGYDLIKLNNDLYNSRKEPKELLNDFFKKVVKPELVHSIKTKPKNIQQDVQLQDRLKESKEWCMSAIKNSTRHLIIPKISELLYPNSNNSIINEINLSCKDQKKITKLNPDVIKYFSQEDKRILLENNVKENISEDIFNQPDTRITSEKCESILKDLIVGNRYIEDFLKQKDERIDEYKKIFKKYGITSSIENSKQHLNSLSLLNNAGVKINSKLENMEGQEVLSALNHEALSPFHFDYPNSVAKSEEYLRKERFLEAKKKTENALSPFPNANPDSSQTAEVSGEEKFSKVKERLTSKDIEPAKLLDNVVIKIDFKLENLQGQGALSASSYEALSPVQAINPEADQATGNLRGEKLLEVKEQLEEYFKKAMQEKKAINTTRLAVMKEKVITILLPFASSKSEKKEINQFAGTIVREAAKINDRKLSLLQKMIEIKTVFKENFLKIFLPEKQQYANIVKDPVLTKLLDKLKQSKIISLDHSGIRRPKSPALVIGVRKTQALGLE